MNGVEGEHRLRPRSRMVTPTPFRIGASQRSIAFAATSAAPAPYHGLGTAAFSTTASSAAAFDRNTWRPSTATPSCTSRLRGDRPPSRRQPASQQPRSKRSTAFSTATDLTNPYSKCSAAFSSCSMMLMLCGHMASQAPHWMQSLARPGAACQLYCCLANSVFSV